MEACQPVGKPKKNTTSASERCCDMGLLLDLIERARQQRRIFVAQIQTSENPPVRRYPLGSAERAEQPIPLFGSGRGFGLDWAYQKAPSPAPQGVARQDVSGPIVNRSGSTADLQPENISPPYEDPNTSRTFKRSNEETDQKIISTRHSSGGSWDGQVRFYEKKPSFESSRGPKEKTPGDKHTADLRRWSFDFSQ